MECIPNRLLWLYESVTVRVLVCYLQYLHCFWRSQLHYNEILVQYIHIHRMKIFWMTKLNLKYKLLNFKIWRWTRSIKQISTKCDNKTKEQKPKNQFICVFRKFQLLSCVTGDYKLFTKEAKKKHSSANTYVLC